MLLVSKSRLNEQRLKGRKKERHLVKLNNNSMPQKCIKWPRSSLRATLLLPPT